MKKLQRKQWFRKGIFGILCVMVFFSLAGCDNKTEKQDIRILDGQTETRILVEEGTTVEQVLADAEIFIGEKDVVEPSQDSVIAENISVISVERFAKVSVMAEGQTKEFTFTGGKVSDAIESAQITLEENDSVNHDLDAYLTDGMSIEVAHNDLPDKTMDGKGTEGHSGKGEIQTESNGDKKRKIVSKEKIYDCDGSGHGYYSITWSDGSVEYEDF